MQGKASPLIDSGLNQPKDLSNTSGLIINRTHDDLPRDDHSDLPTALIRIVEDGPIGSLDTVEQQNQLRTGSDDWINLRQSRDDMFPRSRPTEMEP
jgi:hypothetical protein